MVAADERDAGLRHVLNLGHTVGHALEAASGYDYPLNNYNASVLLGLIGLREGQHAAAVESFAVTPSAGDHTLCWKNPGRTWPSGFFLLKKPTPPTQKLR